MLSKQQQKYIQSLQNKKNRQEEQRFLVEGAKSVIELLESDFEIEVIIATQDFLNKNAKILKKVHIEQVSPSELERLGTLQSNDAAIAVAKMKENSLVLAEDNEYVLVLDDIRDPGNLGTIIRIADWYGINKIICSNTSVEFYNPKVIAATMGSFSRVKIFYTELSTFFKSLSEKQKVHLIGTFLNGENVHSFSFPSSAYIVLGNESKGIGEAMEQLVTEKITIPKFGLAESLNAGIATAIVLDNLRRK